MSVPRKRGKKAARVVKVVKTAARAAKGVKTAARAASKATRRAKAVLTTSMAMEVKVARRATTLKTQLLVLELFRACIVFVLHFIFCKMFAQELFAWRSSNF